MFAPILDLRAWIARLLAVLAILVLAGPAGGCRSRGPDSAAASDLRPTLILVSLDGWRWDYDQLAATPHLDALAARGVRAERLLPVFPTKTFPAHYSIVTGRHPARHGIISNSIHDPELGRFSLSNRNAIGDGRWYGGDPIWVTAHAQGQIAATLFWPGSEAEIGGVRPRYWLSYDRTLSHTARIHQVLEWLDLPVAERPTFITLYFSDTDDAGHTGGPASGQILDAIRRLDEVLGLLVRGLEERELAGRVNLMIVSDHGMAETSRDRMIFLDDYIDLDAVDVIDWSPLLALRPRRDGEALYRALAAAHPRLTVYRREDTPPEWHYRDHPRIPPIVGIADEGWSITRRGRIRTTRGDHGYDPRLASMHGFFVAAGPAFRRGEVVAGVRMIDLYELMTRILGLQPAPNDGDFEAVRPLLAAAPRGTSGSDRGQTPF